MNTNHVIAGIAAAVDHGKAHQLATNPVDQVGQERVIVVVTVLIVLFIIGTGAFIAVRSRRSRAVSEHPFHFGRLAISDEPADEGDLLEAVRLINNEDLAEVAGPAMSAERLTALVKAIAAPRSRAARTHD